MGRRLDWEKSNRSAKVGRLGSEPVDRGFECSTPEPWIPAERVKKRSVDRRTPRKQKLTTSATNDPERKRINAIANRKTSAQIKKSVRTAVPTQAKVALALIAKRKADRVKKALRKKSEAKKRQKKTVQKKKRSALSLIEFSPSARLSEIVINTRGRLRSVVVIKK